MLHQLAKHQQKIGAVILAGGLARRMGGQDKGLIKLANQPMVSWSLRAVSEQVHTVVINANRNSEAYAKLGVPVVADSHIDHPGPLAGLSAGIVALDTDFIFMCPCDSPFIDPTIVEQLGIACLVSDQDIAVAHDGERLQPVFCVVRKSVHASLNEYLAAGDRKIDRWYATQSCVHVDCSAIKRSFMNINTEDELRAAEQELLV